MRIRPARKFTPEVIDFLRGICDEPVKEQARKLAEKFGLKVSYASVVALRGRHGIKRTAPPNCIFTMEMCRFIEDHKDDYDNKTMTDILNGKFGASYTLRQVRLWRKKKGLEYRLFCKEAIEYMRDRPAESYERLRLDVNRLFGKSYTLQQVKSACYWYKLRKFEKKRNVEPTTREDFAERKKISSHSRVEIKVGGKWVSKAKYIYEQSTGEKVGKDELVIFLDGDIYNFEPSNLMRVKRKALLYVNNRLKGTCRNDAELTKCKYDIAGLKLLALEKARELEKGAENEQQD